MNCKLPYIYRLCSYSDCFRKCLMSLREIYPNPNTQLHLVFGCGGNRDRKKRAFMGSIAERYADSIILTSDNLEMKIR